MNGVLALLGQGRLIRLCRWVLGLVFAAAALAKLGDLRSFADQVHNFRLLPVGAENLVALALPWVEIVLALALLLGFRSRGGAWLGAALMGVFTIAVAAAVARGLDFECGCFGTADGSRVGVLKLGQNLVLCLVACVASLRHPAED